MKEVKDLFSQQAATYAAYRPVYPDALYAYLVGIAPALDAVWDCGTGNGQVAGRLAEQFTQVYATDISGQQIANAVQKDNISYHVCRAEHTPLSDGSVDMITVGTALHWFDFDSFYKEVRRVAKPDAIIAAWCYAPFRSTPEVDDILDNFYTNIIGSYWDEERRYVDEEYKTIPFPFEEINAPVLNIKAQWTSAQFIGFLNSWSSVQHYIRKHGNSPVDLIAADILAKWKADEVREIIFPLFMRVGRIK